MIEALFFIPIGPRDVTRAVWTVRSIRNHCKDYRIFLLLDGPDAPSLPTELAGVDINIQSHVPPSNGNWGKIWLMQCRAMCDALNSADVSPRAIFVKIDADALIVRPGLAERAQHIFSTRPSAGQIGQCFTNVLGGRLPNFGWANFIGKMRGARGLIRFLYSSWQTAEGMHAGLEAFRKYRALLRAATINGYTRGEFAIGGCYILRREVITRLASLNLLERSPFRFLPATGEDGIMTPHVYATGYSAIDDVSDGGLFAIEGKKFRVDPFTLVRRGHYVLHPLKYGHQAPGYSFEEDELVFELLNSP